MITAEIKDTTLTGYYKQCNLKTIMYINILGHNILGCMVSIVSTHSAKEPDPGMIVTKRV